MAGAGKNSFHRICDGLHDTGFAAHRAGRSPCRRARGRRRGHAGLRSDSGRQLARLIEQILRRDLDLILDQRDALIAQAFDLLHRDIGGQQILVLGFALRRLDFLLILRGHLFRGFLSVQPLHLDALRVDDVLLLRRGVNRCRKKCSSSGFT